jgi:hypothetical protein
MPRKVAKIKDIGVDKEKSVVKKDVVKKVVGKKDVVKRSRKMRGGGKLKYIISALENKHPAYNEIFDKIIGQFDIIEAELKKKENVPPRKLIAITNTARDTHKEHIIQINKFKSKEIEEIPSLLDLKNLLFYISKIDGYNKIDIKILYTNIIILYIYNFLKIIKDIIIYNNVDIDIADNNAAPAAITAVAPAVSSPVIKTDDAILTRMKMIYDTNITKFNQIKKTKELIYARFSGVIYDMSIIYRANYTQFDLKNHFITLQSRNYITDIKTKYIKEIKDTISSLNTNGALFNALYIDKLEEELKMFESLIDKWISSIDKIVS